MYICVRKALACVWVWVRGGLRLGAKARASARTKTTQVGEIGCRESNPICMVPAGYLLNSMLCVYVNV